MLIMTSGSVSLAKLVSESNCRVKKVRQRAAHGCGKTVKIWSTMLSTIRMVHKHQGTVRYTNNLSETMCDESEAVTFLYNSNSWQKYSQDHLNQILLCARRYYDLSFSFIPILRPSLATTEASTTGASTTIEFTEFSTSTEHDSTHTDSTISVDSTTFSSIEPVHSTSSHVTTTITELTTSTSASTTTSIPNNNFRRY